MPLLGALERLARERGGLVLSALLALTLLFAVGYARLRFTDDPEAIALEGSDALDHYREYVARWGSDELILLGYEVEDAFAPHRLEQLRALTDELLAIEGVRWVSSLDTAFTIDTGPFGPYPRPVVPDRIDGSWAVRERALADPFVRASLVSSDGRALLLAVQLAGEELGETAEERRALSQIEEILTREPFRGLDVRIAGSPVFNRELSRLNRRDNALFTPLVLVVVAALLWLLFRSALASGLALLVVGVSLLWTLGLMGWLGVPMNITTSLLPPLLVVIGVAYSVHVLSGYMDRLRGGADRREALGATVREVAPACFWAAFTTVLGFASLLAVRIESVRSLGLFALVGVSIAFVHSALLLPALLVRLPLERAAQRRPNGWAIGFCKRAAERPALAAGILFGSLAFGALGLPRIEVATHDGEFFSAANPVNRAYRFLESRFGGVTPFEVEIRAPEPGALRGATALSAIHRLQEEMGRIPELSRGRSAADLVRAASPDVDLSDDAAVRRALFLLGALAPDEVEQWLREDARLGRISARAMAMTSARSGAIVEELRARSAELFPRDWQVRFTGLVPVFWQMEQILVEGQLKSFAFAAATIGFVFLLLYRSLAVVAAALAANVVPVAVAAGVMGFGGIRLDVGTVMVASVAMGIIVDDTIHLLQAFRAGATPPGGREAAVSQALELSGRPCVLTSAILVGGFGVLVVSSFRPTAHFGLLVSVAVAAALVGDLLVLPALLVRISRGGGPLRSGALLVVALALLAGASSVRAADAPEQRAVGAFSSAEGALPEGWEPLSFPRIPRQTRYDVVRDGGTWVVRAQSDASASGLIRRSRIDLAEYPVLRWRWKVENVVGKGKGSSKSEDDYAARVYVAFEYDPRSVGLWKKVKYLTARALYGDLPIAALTYVWASGGRVGMLADNPYAPGFVKTIVVEGGPSRVGAWCEEERNVYEDFRLAFGEEPPAVAGVAIMSDSDDTRSAATAFFGDLVFTRGADSRPPAPSSSTEAGAREFGSSNDAVPSSRSPD